MARTAVNTLIPGPLPEDVVCPTVTLPASRPFTVARCRPVDGWKLAVTVDFSSASSEIVRVWVEFPSRNVTVIVPALSPVFSTVASINVVCPGSSVVSPVSTFTISSRASPRGFGVGAAVVGVDVGASAGVAVGVGVVVGVELTCARVSFRNSVGDISI